MPSLISDVLLSITLVTIYYFMYLHLPRFTILPNLFPADNLGYILLILLYSGRAAEVPLIPTLRFVGQKGH